MWLNLTAFWFLPHAQDLIGDWKYDSNRQT